MTSVKAYILGLARADGWIEEMILVLHLVHKMKN